MKNAVFYIFIIAVIVLGGYAAQTNRAQAITITELVELFIALEVIPEENAADARTVLTSQCSEWGTVTHQELVELYIALEIISADNADEARTLAANQGGEMPGPSLVELTELLIALEIIPADKAEEARSVVNNCDEAEQITLEELIELYIALGIIPPEKAEEARAVLGVDITVDLSIELASSNPEGSVIKVGDTEMTTDVGVLVFNLTASTTGTDAKLASLPVRFDTGSANFSDIVDSVALLLVDDGADVVYSTYTVSNAQTRNATAMFDFGPNGLVIPDGTTESVKVLVSFKQKTGNYENGETFTTSVTAAERDAITTIDGYSIGAVDGTAHGSQHYLWSKGIFAEIVSVLASKATDASGNDTGTYEITFDVTAFDGDFYISATDTTAVAYHLEDESGSVLASNGTVQATLAATAVTEGDAYKISDGNFDTFVYTLILDPAVSGTYRLELDSITFGSTAEAPYGLVHIARPDDDFTTDSLLLTQQVVSTQPTTQTSGGGGRSSGGGGGSSRAKSDNRDTTTKATTTASTTTAAVGSTTRASLIAAPATGTVLGVQAFRFNRDLHSGMQNNDVVELQKRLRADGFFTYPTDTGYFGQVTVTAVQAYQTAHGIDATGFVGPLTRASLNTSNTMPLSATVREDEISLEAFVKLLIALALIPADKAETAMAAIATMAR